MDLQEAKKLVVDALHIKARDVCGEHGSYDETTNTLELPDKYEELLQDLERAVELVGEL